LTLAAHGYGALFEPMAGRPLIPLLLVCATALFACRADTTERASAAPPSKAVCGYAQHSVRGLTTFARLVRRTDMDCAVVFNDGAGDWRGWSTPWFLHQRDPDRNWARWATAPGKRRRLVITQELLPDPVAKKPGWLRAGAAGRYRPHARRLAANLVRAGLGDAVIRLGHEANGDWYPHSIGDAPREYRQWRAFWRHTVKAMRGVRGARFAFDWTVHARYRPIPLHLWYPGDDVVDIVGIDAYDSGVRERTGRWRVIYERPVGIRDVARFARRHRKPLSIPEWGVGPKTGKLLAGGDNPEYVRGIARVVRTNRVAYQSYFFAHEWAEQLRRSPRSLAAYRRAFGGS
jgi:Glycosyl hydrolase family 26